MSFKLVGNHLAPAEGETVARTYHCTHLSPVFRLIGLSIDGYLTITNKRIVYFAEGSSIGNCPGSSKFYKEVPIADVTNIALGKGTRFSWLRLIYALVLGQIPAAVIVAIFFGLMTALHVETSTRLMVALQIAGACLLVIHSFAISRLNILRLIFAAIAVSLVMPSAGIASRYEFGLSQLPPIYRVATESLGLLLSCYWLCCLYWFIRREYLTLDISSKSNYPGAIGITAVSWRSRINVAADLASGMAPGIDANRMFKELGALVADIQTMGDQALQKWSQIQDDTVEQPAERTVPQRILTRWAIATVIVIGLLVGGESVSSTFTSKKSLAMSMRHQLETSRVPVDHDASTRSLVPKLLASAQAEAEAGETAFQGSKYTDAMAHWKVAINTYNTIPGIAAALKKSSELGFQYRTNLESVYLQESVSDRLKDSALLQSFSTMIDKHPSPNYPWETVKNSAAEARGLDELSQWAQIELDWGRAGLSLPSATQLMHADIWVKQAERQIKDDNASVALTYLDSALQELPDYQPATQRRELASRMLRYTSLLSGEIGSGAQVSSSTTEITRQLDISGRPEWNTIKSIVANARVLAGQEQWEKSSDAWNDALNRLPDLLLAIRMENMETAARRGNWGTVTLLATRILRDHPDNSRASELKKKGDGIVAAWRAAATYQLALSDALNHELENNQIAIGDFADFTAYMDRYGGDDWSQVKESVSKAEVFASNEQGAESLSEWTKALAGFKIAVTRMHAGIWLERADLASKSNDWTKALLYSERALRIKPDDVHAKELRDQADAIEKKRLNQ